MNGGVRGITGWISTTWWWLLLWLCTPAGAPAQPGPAPAAAVVLAGPVVDELSSGEQVQLSRVDGLLASGQADAAIEILRRIVDDSGDRLVAWPAASEAQPPGFVRYVTARDFGTARLARLAREAPAAFAAYRRQIDSAAAQWLAMSRDESLDETNLRRIVVEALLSHAGDDALLGLGERALERGDYNGARRYWERIHPTLRFPANSDPRLHAASGQPLWLPLRGADLASHWKMLQPLLDAPEAPQDLAYPDTDLNLADVRARLVLVSLQEGNIERAEVELALLAECGAGAVGRIAGREGPWVELLRAQLAAAHGWAQPRPSDDWWTFAGDAARHHRASDEIVVEEGPLWSLPLPPRKAPGEILGSQRVRVGEDAAGVLAYYPIVVGDRVVLQRGPHRGEIGAYDLSTGATIFPTVTTAWELQSAPGTRLELGVERFTLTAAGERLFARTGHPLLPAPGSRERLTMPARLDALDLAGEGRLLWSIPLESPLWGEEWTFGGSPVSDGRRLYVCALRRGPLRLETHVVALDPGDGRVLWRRLAAAAEPYFSDQWAFVAQNLLTVGPGVVYCNTHQGAIAALDADSGTLLWLTTYPRTGLSGTDPDRNDLHLWRDMTPCLLYRDLVIAAPTDCNRLFALDANTGRPTWAARAELGADVIHLLGVIGDYLVASGECLYWWDIHTGRLAGQFPSSFPAGAGFARPSPRGYGRGMLAGQHVYWPTEDAILVFAPCPSGTREGGALVRRIPLASWGATGGHLNYSRGVLLVAAADRLWAFRNSWEGDAGPPRRSDGVRPSRAAPTRLHDESQAGHPR